MTMRTGGAGVVCALVLALLIGAPLAQDRDHVRGKPAEPPARASGYMKIGSIKGESTEKRYEKPGMRLSAGEGGTRWNCEGGNGIKECVCKGMLDCKKLLDSGQCKGGTVWEDGNDPSIGGCDVPED